jgi:uncharacterized membrane protein
MNVRPEFWLLLAVLAAASISCRFGGFWLMRFVRIGPRLDAALKATPVAVMVGIAAPAALHGAWPEWLALATVIIAMKWIRNDLVAAVAGVALLAGLRAL